LQSIQRIETPERGRRATTLIVNPPLGDLISGNVRKANEKGWVENGVGYVKTNLLSGLEIPSFEAIQVEDRRWLDEKPPTSAFTEKPIASLRNYSRKKSQS
jgi:hypothetical protein